MMGMVLLLPETLTAKSLVRNFSLFLAFSAKVCIPGVSSPLQGAHPTSCPSTMTMARGMFVVTVTIVTEGCGGVGVMRVGGGVCCTGCVGVCCTGCVGLCCTGCVGVCCTG